ncbi:carboxypeptidase A1 precursor, putative [Coccidioides posadasii C735 delta SOWgp]|uniref:Carboxypeptidase n=3 Tax=Coccidioides posadasii TaxID=199306 RepID=E9CR56_COCPS|nr:carboxypeptidase A1 precursor, putative [Coccidioides posadasii C735 delta SOWgp]EER28044.1 carboxypeptidase A1 precursor, putative [Coccidioides posadasii C735 delta SOWgp]EFW23187.1 carboxypeptidase [Coccidioides posadasii str. Silveira]|eukprot:XP_003070189.1 carboxypeptidase A1 precursor, putative [Coccidioides posadasii C735 delta SOWgp]
MKSLAVLSTLVASALAAAVPNVNYSGYKVVRIPTEQSNHAKVVDIIKTLKLDTWKYPKAAGSDADIVIPPNQLSAFNKAIAGLKTEIMHEDLGASIESESTHSSAFKAGSYATAPDSEWFMDYHSFDDHMNWLNELQSQHSSNSEIVSVGNSYENRPIQGIHIWGAEQGKPAVVWHGTTHAREWITTMVVEYMAASLLSNSSAADATVQAMLDSYDFYIFPVANPDGFVFTQTRDRMWRKNRTPNQGACPGTDLNRNWPYMWEGSGSSPDPCDETYRGAQPGDAPETQLWLEYLPRLVESQGVKQYIDWHSYSQLFMTPYGYSCSETPDNHDMHISLANAFSQAVEAVHGTSFTTGPICNTIYQANGNSVDWAVDVGNIELGFAAELRDTGRYGFVLPPDQIIPSGEETWAGIKAMFENL